jgi:aminoglycoside 6'-N-acetyltransferase
MSTDDSGRTAPTLHGARVTLRPIAERDRAPMRDILAEPAVAEWWGPTTAEAAADDLFDQSDQTTLVIELDGRVIGSIQFAEENEPDYRHASIDIFLATAFHGLGLGPDALRTLARHLFEERGHHRITIDPAAANTRAIAAYRRVGFRPVGIMRRYERGRDGSFHDGLLMDLLAGELA